MLHAEAQSSQLPNQRKLMKKVFYNIAVVAGLVLAVSTSYAQDTRRERPRRETTNDDMETEEETHAEEDVPAQKQKAPRIGVGIGMEAGVGVNYLDMRWSDAHVDATGTIGLFADIQMAGRFYVQPGLYYMRNGAANVTLNRVGTPWGLNMRITTIEVPVMFAYRSGTPGTRVRFTIGAGGYVGYNAGANLNGIPLNIGDDAVNDDIKALEAGLGLNVGIELRNGLFFRLKSQRGLTDLQPDNSGQYIYTSSDVITIGYLWRKHARRHHAPASNEEQAAGRRM